MASPAYNLFDRARAAAKRALGIDDEEVTAYERQRQEDLRRQQAASQGLTIPTPDQIGKAQFESALTQGIASLRTPTLAPVVNEPAQAVAERPQGPQGASTMRAAPGLLERIAATVTDPVDQLPDRIRTTLTEAGVRPSPSVDPVVEQSPIERAQASLAQGADPASAVGDMQRRAAVETGMGLLGGLLRGMAQPVDPDTGIPNADIASLGSAWGVVGDAVAGGKKATNLLDEAAKAAQNAAKVADKTDVAVKGAEDLAQAIPSKAAAQELARLSAEKRGMQLSVGRAIERGELTGRQAEIAEEMATRTLSNTKLPRTKVREEGLQIYREQPEKLAALDDTTPTTPQLEYAAGLKYGELLDKHVALEQQIAEAPDAFTKTGLEDALGALEGESERLMRFLNRTGTEAGQALAHRANILRHSPDTALAVNAERMAKRTRGRALTDTEKTQVLAATADTKKARRQHNAAREQAADKALGGLPGESAFRRRIDQLSRDSQTKVADAIKSRVKSLKAELERRTNQAMTERSGLGQDMEPPSNAMTPEELALVADDPTVKALNEMVQNMRLQQRRGPLKIPNEFETMRKRTLTYADRRIKQLERRVAGEPEVPARDLTKLREKIDKDPEVIAARERMRELERKLAEHVSTPTLGPIRGAFAGLRSGLLTGVETILFRNPLSTYADATVRRTLSDNAAYLIEAFSAARAEGDNVLQAARRAATRKGRASLTLLGAPTSRAQAAELFDARRFGSTLSEAVRTGVNPATMATLGETPQAVGDIKTVYGGAYDRAVNAPLRLLGGADAAATANFQATEMRSIAEASARLLAQAEGRPLDDVADIVEEMMANPTAEMVYEAQRRAGLDAYNNSVIRGKAVDGQRSPIAESGETVARLFSTPAERMVGTENRVLTEGFDALRSGAQTLSGAYFLRTPVNLGERLAERVVPLGALATERGKLSTLRAEAVKSALRKHGKAAFQREIDKAIERIDDAVLRKRVADALGENVSGAALTAAGAVLASAGVLVYSGASSDERAQADMADRPLVALRLPTGSLPGVNEDIYVDVSFMAPVMPNVVGGAAMQQYIRDLEQQAQERGAVAPDAPPPTPLEGAVSSTMKGAGVLASMYGGNFRALAEMPLLQGPSRTVDTLTTLPDTLQSDDPKRVQNAMSRFVGDAARPFVPSIISDAAKLADPTKRERLSRDYPLAGGVMERVPGLREKLQPKINRATGQPITQDRVDVLTPMSVQDAGEWEKFLDANNFVPGDIKIDTKNGESDTTYTRRQQVTYAARAPVMQALLAANPGFEKYPDKTKQRYLDEISSEATNLITEQIKGRNNPTWAQDFDRLWDAMTPENRAEYVRFIVGNVLERVGEREQGRAEDDKRKTLLDQAIEKARQQYGAPR